MEIVEVKIYIERKTTFEKKLEYFFFIQKILYFIRISVKFIDVELKVFKKV